MYYIKLIFVAVLTVLLSLMSIKMVILLHFYDHFQLYGDRTVTFIYDDYLVIVRRSYFYM